MTLPQLSPLVRSGDTASLDRLTAGGALEGTSVEVKAALTRQAAQAGQAEMLRLLFEKYHLYDPDPDARGRTPLHYAAMSGDPETILFALDVLGYDPLTGDALGQTALDYASRASDPEGYAVLSERLGFSLSESYRNPILRGFHPDPSVVRVGEDYYLVNSSFTFFPGLPVFHSRDLVHWRLISHAVENLDASGLKGLPGGFGYWAPDISFYRGKFWVAAPLRRSTPPFRLQMLISATDPHGPWSAPKFLPLDGIDPSLFADEDGRRYILLNPGAIMAELDEDGNLISAPEMIFFGSARIKPEGPHLLKKDGWYYLFLAEGGTGPDHMETVQRSRNLRGPYEPCPFNPILGKRNPFSPVQRSGHGKPVSTPDGRWFMVYLCGRSVEGKTVMGWDHALDPVLWTADGWPMVNQLRGPSCLQALPLPEADTPLPPDAPDWISPRGDPARFADISVSRIRLRAGADPAGLEPCSLLLLRQAEASFSQSVCLDLSDAGSSTLAGLTGYYDECSFFLFGLRKTPEGCDLILLEQKGAAREIRVLDTLPGFSARLRVEADGLRRRFYVDPTDEAISSAPPLLSLRTEYLSDEGAFGQKRFTGATLGLAAIGTGTARFDAHRVRFLPPRERVES